MPQDGKYVNLYGKVNSAWYVIGQATDLQVSKSRSTQRVQHKDSNDSIPIAGSIERTFTLNNFYFANDAGQAAIDSAFETDTEMEFRMYEYGTAKKQFKAKVTNIQQSHPVGNAATVSITLEPTETPYSV